MVRKKAKTAGIEYTYAEGRTLPVEAQVAGEELARIEHRDGGISPKVLVDESRPEEAPLHPCFEWDDAVAAEHWREDQARHIVRSVRVVYNEPTGERKSNLAYVSTITPESEGRTYVSAAKALSDESMRDVVLADCVAQLRGFVNRYRHLTEMSGLFGRIRKFIEELERAEVAR